ncbi:MAG: hypothetical protein LBT77_01035 [Mycoplasmataceae bacterium]|nr:hypothetical protein [Mycoplasmataceae bacterium]
MKTVKLATAKAKLKTSYLSHNKLQTIFNITLTNQTQHIVG